MQKQVELTEDEILEIQRAEAIGEYGKKISALKDEELELQGRLSNLRAGIDDETVKRNAEFEYREQEISNRCSELDALEIKAKSTLAAYEKDSADLANKISTFETYRSEKQAEIDTTIADLVIQKDKIAHVKGNVDAANEAIVAKNIEHDEKALTLNEKQVLLEKQSEELRQFKVSLGEAQANLKTEKDAHATAVQAEAVLRSEYITKNTELEAKFEQVAVLKVDLSAKVARLNEQKSKLEDLSLQLKSDKAILDKERESFNQKQQSLTIQIDKLEKLKSELQVKE